MYIDFRQTEDKGRLETDLCIIGAGAAGITIGREFAQSNVKVTIVESGGLEFEPETQFLYEGENVGLDYDLEITRLRFFGGTTSHWAGFCGPLSEIDFRERPWVRYSGWPISRDSLLPYYRKAQPICGLGPYRYDNDVRQEFDAETIPIDTRKIKEAFWQMSIPLLRFGEAYRSSFSARENLDVLLHANITTLQTNEAGTQVEYVEIRSLSGKSARLYAKYFVLSCGGIENPRLLLLSNRVESKGLGNRYDVVGRFFMEHPTAQVGQVISNNFEDWLELYLPRRGKDAHYYPHFRTAEFIQEQKRTLHTALKFEVRGKKNSGATAAKEIYRKLKRGDEIDDLGHKLWLVLRDLDEVAEQTYRRFVLGKSPLPPIESVVIVGNSEQAPNPDSRVTLSHERDALGLNQVKLDWRVTELDRNSFRVVTEALGAELGRLGLGRVHMNDWVYRLDTVWEPGYSFHHMGTTRMAADPKFGVVDGDCKVHGVSNLFIAGSSVFPACGYMNPTLTIVSLALRLGDHIKSKLL